MDYDFERMTTEHVAEILMTALDNGEWHTPGVTDVKIDELSSKVVRYGSCKISLHSNYHDQPYMFNINRNSVHIWQDSSLPGRVKTLPRSIYNLREVIQKIDQYAGLILNHS